LKEFADGIDRESGFLAEAALFSVLAKTGSSGNTEKSVAAAEAEYVRHGITTACEAWFLKSDLSSALWRVCNLDLVVFPICLGVGRAEAALQLGEQVRRLNHPRVTVGGAKLVMDGSIQAYTASLTQPYLSRPESRGVANYTQEEADAVLEKLRHSHLQIHCNGDAVIDMTLNALEKLGANRGTRVTIIHCQTVRDDQLACMKHLAVNPSFFTSHTHYWGDRHHDIFLGAERANRIDPCRSAIAAGLLISNHHDR
jgi:predicted amidohydrolase YtcJ